MRRAYFDETKSTRRNTPDKRGISDKVNGSERNKEAFRAHLPHLLQQVIAAAALQNPGLREQLLSTGKATLGYKHKGKGEVLGIGRTQSLNWQEWPGRNLIGKAYRRVRELIQEGKLEEFYDEDWNKTHQNPALRIVRTCK